MVPTLLLDLDGLSRGLPSHQHQALRVLATLAPARVLPVLRHLAEHAEALESVIPALQLAGDRETLRTLCELPKASARRDAAEALRALGEEPPAASELPPPSALVTHPCRAVRESALTGCEQTGDPALMTSILAARTLHAAIGRRFGGPVGSYGQYLRQLPKDLRHQDHTVQLRAVRAGEVPDLPEQVIWPSVRPILDGDVDALAAAYRPPTFTIDPATAQALRHDEAAGLEAMRAA